MIVAEKDALAIILAVLKIGESSFMDLKPGAHQALPNWITSDPEHDDDKRRVHLFVDQSMKLFWMIIVLGAVGCSSYVAPLEPQTTRSWLPFLIEGRTSKEEVLNRLGTPFSEYEDGNISVYILRENLNSQLQVSDFGRSDWNPEIYNLVLVFGPTKIVEKYSLVRVR
jgi:hypothetical protein